VKQFIKSVGIVGVLLSTLHAEVPLTQKIGEMMMVGFHGTIAPKGSQICRDIQQYHLGGVILFDYNPVNKNQPKNIVTKQQLAQLTQQLQACSHDGKLLIAVDQEGGRVQRLKRKYGFYGQFPKAKSVATMSDSVVRRSYRMMAKELHRVGINYNLAPVVDLALNPKNHVIFGLGRSFGRDPQQVAHYATLFIDAMHHHGVLTALKHFPGHGSSLGDTHRGFVDVTHLWQKQELTPYRLLHSTADTVMVAHVFNKQLDSTYPATLSAKTVNGLLRQKLGFEGVVITDDLQMGAIAKKYGLRNTLKLAINAGDDILLFGNQLDPRKIVTTKRLVMTVRELVKRGAVKRETIERAYQRIRRLKQTL